MLWRGITTNEKENAPRPPNDCEEIIIDLPPQVLEPPPQWAKCCIYRVPKRLRQVKGESYTPKLISIGPFHHDKEELKDMEKLKLTYYMEFLQRTGTEPRDIASIIAKRQQKIIYCYDGRLEISSQDILKIVLLDSIFIIEYFVRATAGGENRNNQMEHNRTEDLFRNIMALEQCHYPLKAYLCNYMVLLDHLINTSEDVELLADNGIIVNALGSYEVVATMVNRIAVEIVEENSCYSDVAKDLKNHYRKGCNRNIGYLKSPYFSNLWRGTATVVGLIILGFTLWDFVRSTVK
ncbi:uncharacterized protein LOC115985036 [Quercus lobata]|uniref:uncharacterized protein LOC115985036 n=1 Tax=Quercus lobata TaxID=97700 RepID=UPI001246F0EE|nr:uncharacterized protein LOC115985036 [Quercus lobata]